MNAFLQHAPVAWYVARAAGPVIWLAIYRIHAPRPGARVRESTVARSEGI